MIVREAYRDTEHIVCREHWDGTLALPSSAPPLGGVRDARDHTRNMCEYCDPQEIATRLQAAMIAALRGR